MFTKNWYNLYAKYATGSSSGTFKGVAPNGNEYNFDYITSSNNLGGVMLYPLLSNVNFRSGFSNYGVYFGTGNTAPTLNDYKLSGSALTDSSKCTASVVITGSVDDGGITVTAKYTITNGGSSDVTIGEIGLFAYNAQYQYYLVERTALETPVTIAPAGGVGQVTYTIRLNYPT